MTMRAAGARRPTLGRGFLRAVGPRLGRSALTAVVTCLPVALIAGVVRTQTGPLVPADVAAIVAATDVTRAHPRLWQALLTYQEATQPWRVHLACLPIALLAWWRGLRSRAAWAVVTLLVGWNVGLDVKLLVRRARPVVADPVALAPGFSFPSGHVFNVTLALATLAVLLWPLLRRHRGVIAGYLLLATTLVVITALDRVFLGVHYPSDTVAGALLALGFVTASWVGFGHTPWWRTSPTRPAPDRKTDDDPTSTPERRR